MRPLTACLLFLVGCSSADGLNFSQRGYLLEDSRHALGRAAEVNAMALVVGIFFGEGTFDPAVATETNVGRVTARANSMLAGCAGAIVEGNIVGVDVNVDCEVDGVRFVLDATAIFTSGSGSVTEDASVYATGGSVGGVETRSADVFLTAGARPQMVTTATSFDWRDLEFDGVVTADALTDAAILTGTGRWLEEESEEGALPVQFDSLRVSPRSCGIESGAMRIGPRSVLIAPEETTEITQELLSDGTGSTARIRFGATEEAITAACPASEF